MVAVELRGVGGTVSVREELGPRFSLTRRFASSSRCWAMAACRSAEAVLVESAGGSYAEMLLANTRMIAAVTVPMRERRTFQVLFAGFLSLRKPFWVEAQRTMVRRSSVYPHLRFY